MSPVSSPLAFSPVDNHHLRLPKSWIKTNIVVFYVLFLKKNKDFIF